MKSSTLVLFFVATTFLLGSVGCNKKPSENPADKQAPQSVAVSKTTAPVDETAILANVDGVIITVADFQDRINRQSPYIRGRYTSVEQKQEFLDNLVRFELLAAYAKKQGLDSDPDVVRTLKQAMIQKLMKAKLEGIVRPEEIAESDMLAYYEANPEDYHKPEEVRVSAIVLSDKDSASRVAKLALGNEGSSNKGFRNLVKEYSVDKATKERGGDLRYFSKESNDLPKPIVEAAFALEKVGAVTGPIQAGDQFYILKQTGRRKAIDKTFAQVKRQIQNKLYRERRTEAQKEFIDKLRNEAEIQIFQENLNKVKVDTSAPAETHPPHSGHESPPHHESDHESHVH